MQLTCHVKRENIRCRLALMIRRLTVQLHIHHDDPTRRVLLLGTCTWVTREKMKKYNKKEREKPQLIITYITVTLPFVEVSIAPSTFHKSFNTAIHIKALGTPAAQLKKARQPLMQPANSRLFANFTKPSRLSGSLQLVGQAKQLAQQHLPSPRQDLSTGGHPRELFWPFERRLNLSLYVCVSVCAHACVCPNAVTVKTFATAKHYRKVSGLFHICCKLGLWVLQCGTKYTLGKTRLCFHFLHCRGNPKLACSDTVVQLCCQGQCTNSIQWLFD